MNWFHGNQVPFEWILNDIACKLNWIEFLKFISNWIKLDSDSIELKKNEMHIGVKDIENLFIYLVLKNSKMTD
jgi:hypothetical protein